MKKILTETPYLQITEIKCFDIDVLKLLRQKLIRNIYKKTILKIRLKLKIKN